MGISGSKDADVDEDAKFVQDPALIFWDESGNLRYGIFNNVIILLVETFLIRESTSCQTRETNKRNYGAGSH
jgi:hypothetical protein